MQCKAQVVTLRDDGEESLREVACIERDDLSAVSLGLSIADSKAIVPGMQEVVVAWQMNAYLDTQRHGPQCGKLRHRKGVHHAVLRTVFGDVPVESPRFIHCPCQAHETESFQTPPDLVVKFQPIDITDVILWRILRPRIVNQRKIKGYATITI